jgi:diguanylate cyclase (GGDEF)-like protein/PAS domain S-box-containing protein
MTHVGTHDGTLVGLSVLIATVASYTALDLAGRVHASSGWAKHAWLATAALAMGGGVWAMHFVAMLAFSLPGVRIDYDLGLTAVSLVLPILATGFSFYLVTWTDGGLPTLIRSGLVMGAGIVGMHYTGMAAMRMAADVSHEALWVAVSVLIAIGASTTALWLAFRQVGLAQRLLAAPVMGLAIAGMHYAAMQGAILTAHSPADEAHGLASLSQISLAVAVAAATFSILFLALIAALFDRRFAALAEREALALRESEERYRALLEASAVVFWFAAPSGMITRSHGWTKLCGQTESEYADLGWINVVHPDDQGRIISLWQQALSSAGFYQGEFRVRHTDGEYRWVLASAVPRKNPDGEILEWVGGISDIHARKLAEERLQASEQRLRLVIETTGLGIWDVDLITGEREWTPETRSIVGVAADDPIKPDTFMNCVHSDDRARVGQRFYGAASTNERGYSDTYRILRADTGKERWVTISGRLLADHKGQPLRRIGTIQDVTQHKQAEDALRSSEERLGLALYAGRMFAWELDLATNYVTRSPHARTLLGVGSGALSDFLARIHPDDYSLRNQFVDRIGAGGVETVEFRYMLPDGKTMWLGSRAEQAGPDRIVGVTFDITDRKMAEAELWRLANHDGLTGIPNRVMFQERLEQALAEAKRQGTSVGLLVIDLDEFKDINDSFGHDAGDALLKETAVRLSAMVRKADTVARLGGDEFVVLLSGSFDLEHAAARAKSIARTLSQPVFYAGQVIASRASIGVSAFHDHHAGPADLMKDADIALYQAKAEGRNRVVTYSPEMRAATDQRIALRREMREAISLDQIRPFYQPKVCLSTGEVMGLEALARWEHPTKGVLTPSTFGPIFDDPELATMVGKRLIGKVASDMRRWLDNGLSFGHVAINLSHVEFMHPDLAENILSILDREKVSPQQLEIEITERVLLDAQSDAVSSALEKLRARGVEIALDDFGTGFASLTHLKQFAVDHIKIDRSFVQGIEDDPDDEAIVTAVIGLGRSLNLRVTAEGVETAGQAQRLREMGCGAAQGYLYAKPINGSEVPEILSHWSPEQTPSKKLLLAERH